ncbi:hypothetical protein GGR56DRAFT_670800 [Xylariaceae sp. FL0804]|nr:hypothetical protein GGR56DRAFT_670800 [Xylariaceae sp. FL0804]
MMTDEKPAPAPDVAIYRSAPPPAALEDLLRAHGPHALPLARRLRFTRFPGGVTPHARKEEEEEEEGEEKAEAIYGLLYASSSPLSTAASSSTTCTTSSAAVAAAAAVPFAAGYLDLSRGPETELWLYASLERGPEPAATATGEEEGQVVAGSSGRSSSSAECAVALMRAVRRERDAYVKEKAKEHEERESTNSGTGTDSGNETATAAGGGILIGTLAEPLRRALAAAGAVFSRVEAYDKWLLRVDGLPPTPTLTPTLPPPAAPSGTRWGAVRAADIPYVLSRTHIPRKERTVKLLPSTALYLDDGRPIAWGFLGPDSSLTSLHCEPDYRGRGLAKAVAAKLLRDHLGRYGEDSGYGFADVAPDNPSSQGVCRSLGGEIMSQVSWSVIDLDQSFPGQ